jgi:hypothetical protein
MRAAKTIGSTGEAAVRIRAGAAEHARLAGYAAELPGLLLVAEAVLDPPAGGAPAEPTFSVSAAPADPARYRKCERCWMHRDDVSADGLCGRCRDALARGAGAAITS